MLGLNSLTLDERFLASGDEAGTAPDDRRFRPDVEGLRAVAVLLVVFYHAGFPRVTGGLVGVDVFFVISGFVITGLLLRERRASGRTSILDASDAAGNTIQSKSISLVVKNRLPSRSDRTLPPSGFE